MSDVVEYFKDAACILGFGKPAKDPSHAATGLRDMDRQANYSLAWYFMNYFARDLAVPNSPLAAFMGAGTLPAPGPAVDVRERLAGSGGVPLNDAQITAVERALREPVSIIKGPPGTGKTEVILHIVALALERGERVAVVSSNGEAVSNVVEKLDEAYRAGPQNLLYKAACALAPLGNARVRETATSFEDKEPFGFTAAPGGVEPELTFANFTAEHPLITSTIHSLRKCFKDGTSPHARYDLLIMDEASQTNVVVGAVALSAAKRAVIVGDEEQLAPVLSDARLRVLRSTPAPHPDLDVSTANYSFLDACYKRFPQAPTTMLVEHYRCHPAIIAFNNEYVYDGKLVSKAQRPTEPAFPLALRWYNGEYREGVWMGSGSSSANSKQLTIFREEELPLLRARLAANPEMSVCILTPFRGQLEWLTELIAHELDLDEKEYETKELAKVAPQPERDDEGGAVQALTIHKSQGQGFDLVYLLPVEDGNWEWPWSQGSRLINVAVSRAKKELRVVASTKLMSDALQEQLAHGPIKVKDPADEAHDLESEQLFVRKLAEYIAREGAHAPAPYGVLETEIESIFDDLPRVQRPDNTWDAPERIVRPLLVELAAAHDLLLYEHCSVTNLGGVDTQKDWMHVDFLLVTQERDLVMGVEVDGGQHRFARKKLRAQASSIEAELLGLVGIPANENPVYEQNREYIERDAEKDDLLRTQLGIQIARLGRDSNLRQRRDDLEHKKEGRFDSDITSPSEATGPVLLRLPTDGSTFLETAQLRARHPHAVAAPTIEDYLTACLAAHRNAAPHKHIPVGGLSLSQSLKEEDIPVSARDAAPQLGGYIERIDGSWPPTKTGADEGIFLCHKNSEQRWPMYSQRARGQLRGWLGLELGL